MVKLRLSRMGKKKMPIYKIIAADSRSPRDGRFIEAVGLYNPNVNPMQIDLKEEKVFRWFKNGAVPTDTVRSLLRKKGILHKWHLMKKGFSIPEIEESMQKWQILQSEKLAKEETKKLEKKKKSSSKKSAE